MTVCKPTQLYWDGRIGGEGHWIIGHDPAEVLVRVPDHIKECVCFLCVKMPDGRYRYGGTAILISVPSDNPNSEYTSEYLLTAKHCIKKAEEVGQLYVRLNKRDKTSILKEIKSEWIFSEDEGVDVAVTPFPTIKENLKQLAINTRGTFATEQEFETYKFGIGDDVFAVGLFTLHHGKDRNLPIVRSGIISAMPEEPLTDPDTNLPYKGYLIEARSIGGLSGSPVFVTARINPDQPRYQGRPDLSMQPTFTYFLLGIIRGHWDISREKSSIDFAAEDERDVNMGMAIATPIQEVIDLLRREDLVKERRKQEAKEAKNSGQKYDSAFGAEPMQTTAKGIQIPIPATDQFFDDLEKASRKKE